MIFKKASLLLTLLFLCACQTVPKITPETSSQQEWKQDNAAFIESRARLAQLNEWSYSAKVGIKSATVNEVANMVWHYSDQSNSVRLFGPLGMGAIKIEFDQFGVVLSDGSGVRHRGGSAQDLLTKIVGWPIPIDALGHWLHVLPSPGAVYRYQLDEANLNVAVLEQLGWQIVYSAYRDYGKSMPLPRKIMAKRTLPDDSVITIKLITKTWTL